MCLDVGLNGWWGVMGMHGSLFDEIKDRGAVMAEVVGVCGHRTKGYGQRGTVAGVEGQLSGDLLIVLGIAIVAAVGAHICEQQGQLGGGGKDGAAFGVVGRACLQQGCDVVGQVSGERSAYLLTAVLLGCSVK